MSASAAIDDGAGGGIDRSEADAVTSTARTAGLALAGARDMAPTILGLIPFALAIGAAASASSLSTAEALASGPAILAGSAQLTTIQLLDAGAEPLVVVVSALMINARILLYSASLASWFRDEPLRRRLVLAAPVIDQLHLLCAPRFERGDLDGRARRLYYLGAAVALAGSWTITQWLAVIGGARLPDAAGLHLAAPLALAGLLARSLTTTRGYVAAGAAAVIVVAGNALPFHSAVLVAALGGIAVGSIGRRNEEALS